MGHFKRNSGRYLFSIGFLLGCAACLYIGGDLKALNIPGVGSIETWEENDITHLETVWADEVRRETYLALLAHRGVFVPTDPQIVDAITGLCEPIPEAPLDAHLDAARACADKPVPERLRELADRKAPPFHYSGRRVRIGVPDETDQPHEGYANTCLNGEWYRQDVVITNPRNGRYVEVYASGHFGRGICGEAVGAADIQLSERDAFKIFDGSIDKYEDAVAITAN